MIDPVSFTAGAIAGGSLGFLVVAFLTAARLADDPVAADLAEIPPLAQPGPGNPNGNPFATRLGETPTPGQLYRMAAAERDCAVALTRLACTADWHAAGLDVPPAGEIASCHRRACALEAMAAHLQKGNRA